MKLQPVKEHPGYRRDPETKAILCTDNAALQAYKARRAQKDQLKHCAEEINKLKEDISEIKLLLREIIGRH